MTYQELDIIRNSINKQLGDMEAELLEFRRQTLHVVNLSSIAKGDKAVAVALASAYETIMGLQTGTNELEYFMNLIGDSQK